MGQAVRLVHDGRCLPAEFYFRHVIARHLHATGYRLKEITQPTLVLVGNNEDEVIAGVHHIESAQVLVNGTPADRLVMLNSEGHGSFVAKTPTRHPGLSVEETGGRVRFLVLWKRYTVQDLTPRTLRLITRG